MSNMIFWLILFLTIGPLLVIFHYLSESRRREQAVILYRRWMIRHSPARYDQLPSFSHMIMNKKSWPMKRLLNPQVEGEINENR